MTGPTRRYRFDPYMAKVLPSPTRFTCPSNVVTAFVAPVAPALAAKAVVAAPRFVLVNFKQEAAFFLAPFKLTVGDRVVVEGDRGEHVGRVECITTTQPASFTGSKKVLRRCTETDLAKVAAKTLREESAVRKVQVQIDSLGLSKAVVYDTELQFDEQKLTIYVKRPSSKTFVDFRKLQRGLFREFRCRIWLAYMDEVEVERKQLCEGL